MGQLKLWENLTNYFKNKHKAHLKLAFFPPKLNEIK